MSEMSYGTKVTIGVGIALTVVGVGVGLYFALRKKPAVNPIDKINKQNAVPVLARQPVRQQQQQPSTDLIGQAGGLLSSIFSKKKTSTPTNNNVKPVATKPQPSVTDYKSTVDASNAYFQNYQNTGSSQEYNPYWYLDSPDTASGNVTDYSSTVQAADSYLSNYQSYGNTGGSETYNPYWYQSAPIDNGD
jgi:hypothetical protein